MAGKIPGQTANVAVASEPPFSIGGSTMATGSDGGTDYTKNNYGDDGLKSSDHGEGCDFTTHMRFDGDAKQEVVPNSQEIPAGGKVLMANPNTFSRTIGQAPAQPSAAAKPFKNLK